MKQNLFDLIPEIDKRITTEKEGELSVLAFPRFRNKFVQKYLVPKNKTAIVRVRLDEHGTAVWNLIDGRRTVGKIAEHLAEHFNHEENYEYRVGEFVMQLYKQGFVKSKKV
ncbi:MAG: PqqD family protein [Bacteroidales bacterium]|nr:PqqD family protein [Bacteroidales bacterium]